MKKILLLATALVAFLFVNASSFPYDSIPKDPLHTRIYKLDNGLTVYLSRNTAKPEIQTFIAVRAGGKNDPLESTGLAHYQEHIMFKGTSQYGTTDYAAEKPYLDAIDSLYEVYSHTSDENARQLIYREIDSVSYLGSTIAIANEFDKLMSIIGATGVNAFTSTEMTCYHEVIPAGELTRWAMIESGRFQDLVIRGFHTELETVYEEFNMYSTMDYDKIDQAINNILYKDIPYRQHSVIGTQEHLKNPSLKNIKNFYNTYYRPNNVAICLAGDLDYDHAIATIEQYFGQWQANDSLNTKHQTQDTKHQTLNTHKDTIVLGKEAPECWLAWRLPNILDDDIDIIEIMSEVLYNGTCGLIDLDIEQKQLLLAAGAGADQASDFSTFYLIGYPKQKQKLEDVRKILLSEIKKLKAGDFSEELIDAIIANKRRYEMEQQDNNRYRTMQFVYSFIYGIPYERFVHNLDNLQNITKADIVYVANKYLGDNYACIFKQQSDDETPAPVQKPTITPIETNRERSSQFATDLAAMKSNSLTPEFLDFEKDITRDTLPNGQELIYRHNDNNELFYLYFIAEKGTDYDPVIDVATDLLPYLGTHSMSAEQFAVETYNQAAYVDIYNDEIKTTFAVSGLQSNFLESVNLLEQKALYPVPDDAVLKEVIADRIKEHNDAKFSQDACFNQLLKVGMKGLNPIKQQMLKVSPKALKKQSAGEILSHVTTLLPSIKTVIYYGPASIQEVTDVLSNNSKIIALGQPALQKTAPHLANQVIDKPEVWIAPYKANNIYLFQYANCGKKYDPKDEAIIMLFNEYFSGSMGSIVFQEMRERRALCYASFGQYATPSFAGENNGFVTYIISQNDKMKDCLQAFDSICNYLPISQTAFDQAKASLLKQIEQRRYVGRNAINAYLRYRYLGWDHDYYEDIYQNVQSLTLKDIQRFQRRNIANQTYRYLILGDKKQLDTKYLRSLGKIKHLKLKDIFVY